MARKKKEETPKNPPGSGTLREVKQEDPKYSSEEFVIPSSDNKGHSDRITVRCVGGQLRQASELIHARKFPYKTVSDLFRHALYRHLQWLAFLEPKIEIQMGIMEATVEIARTQQILLQFQNTVEEVKETVVQLEKAGMKGQARKLIFNILKRIEAEAGDSVWKDKLREEIQTRYGYLLKQGSSLTTFEEEK